MLARCHLASATAVVAALVSLTNGCSSAVSDEGAPLEFRGTYESTSKGWIQQITFAPDMQYELRPDGCSRESCAEKGTYALDQARRTLTLASDTGQARSLSVDVIASSTPKPSEAQLVTQGLVTGGALPLVEPGKAVSDGTVQKALVGGQPVQLTEKATSCLVSSVQTQLVDSGDQVLNPQCGFYEVKTCEPGKIIEYYTKDVDGLLNLADGAGDCVGCAGALTGAAIVAGGGTVLSDGLLAVPAGALAATLTASGCAGCYNTLRDSGILGSVDCTLFPCQYSPAARQRECQATCKTAYAYVPRVGTACKCTNSAAEACCRARCYDGTEPDASCKCGGSK